MIENLAAGIIPEDCLRQEAEEREGKLILNRNAVKSLRNSSLFYPCSGDDLGVPIRLFAPFINDFWFVDVGYFAPGDQNTRDSGLDAPADKQKPVLDSNGAYALIDTNISGPPRARKRGRGTRLCVLTETYKHLPTGRTIRIHRCRGDGLTVFREEIRSIGVFFYRRDSQGEGGSGERWT